jgi:hypothetical protein
MVEWNVMFLPGVKLGGGVLVSAVCQKSSVSLTNGQFVLNRGGSLCISVVMIMRILGHVTCYRIRASGATSSQLSSERYV